MTDRQRRVPYLTEQARLWSENVGPMLCRMLNCTGYEPSTTIKYVDFFSNLLAPALGTFPEQSVHSTAWKSFMTDDSTPVEFSFSYSGQERVVRLAIEPISQHAGTPVDPFNLASTDRLVEVLMESIGQYHVTWYNILRGGLMADRAQLERHKCKGSDDQFSQFFVGFDLGHREISMKFYFLPAIRAACLGKTSFQLMSDILPSLEVATGSLRPAFSLIEWYLLSANVRQPKLEIVSIDCCKPSKSRLKLYIRDEHTSFERAWDFFTLGGTIQHMCCDEVFHTLKSLWYLVLGLPNDFPEEKELAPSYHYTAGTIYYFSLRPGSPIPEPKVYIPVRHYARSDQEIAQGLEKAFRWVGWEHHAEDYIQTITSIFLHRSLNATTGVQTYISFSMKNGSIAIESYLNPGMDFRSIDH